MKRLGILLMCFILLLSAPMTVNAGSLTTTIRYIQKSEKMTNTGYAQQKIKCRALPSTKAKAVCKIKVNTEIKYHNYNKKWAITVHKGHIVFIQRKFIKQSEYTPSYFKRMGVISYNGWRWTWYSQRVLPGSGLRIPGRHVDERGFVCDSDNYICLASNSIGYGGIIDTPFGKKGKVYDSGCDWVDVYTDF